MFLLNSYQKYIILNVLFLLQQRWKKRKTDTMQKYPHFLAVWIKFDYFISNYFI